MNFSLHDTRDSRSKQNREKTQRGRGETLVGGARAAVHHWFGGVDPLWAATAGAVETRRGGDGAPAMAWWRFPPLQPPSLIGLGF